MEVKTLLPIFILKTRSFWLGIAPAVLTILDVMFAAATGGEVTPVASAIATVLGRMFGWTSDEIFGFMAVVSPIYALVVAQQRSGITRPYASTPTSEKTQPTAVLVKEVQAVATDVVKKEVANAVKSMTQSVLSRTGARK